MDKLAHKVDNHKLIKLILWLTFNRKDDKLISQKAWKI